MKPAYWRMAGVARAPGPGGPSGGLPPRDAAVLVESDVPIDALIEAAL